MTPGNYTTHAIEDLTAHAREMKRVGALHDASYLETLCRILAVAEKFMLPDGGMLFSEGSGREGPLPHLPYPCMVLEFSADAIYPKIQLLPGQIEVPRRIVAALENKAQTGYAVTTVDYLRDEGRWNPCPIAMTVCSQRVPELAPHAQRMAACHALEMTEAVAAG